MSDTYVLTKTLDLPDDDTIDVAAPSAAQATIDYLSAGGPPIDNDLYVAAGLTLLDSSDGTASGATTPFTNLNTDGSEYLLPFKLIYTKTISRRLLTSGQISILKQVHVLGDISYGDNEFGNRDGQDAAVYMPVSADDTAEPSQTDTSSDSDGDSYSLTIEHDLSESQAIKEKFGGLPSEQSAESVIRSQIESLTNDAFQSLISRENIPNVVANTTDGISIDDLDDELPQTLSISTTSTSVTTY